MKKSAAAFTCAAVIVATAVLTACDRGQSLPEPAVELPVELASFTVVKYDYDYEFGDYKYKFELSKAQQKEFLKLLQADQWADPGELPGRDYLSIVDAANGAGWNLTVGHWDEEHTLIALFNDNQTEKIFYFAPAEVQKKIRELRGRLKG